MNYANAADSSRFCENVFLNFMTKAKVEYIAFCYGIFLSDPGRRTRIIIQFFTVNMK